MDSFNNEKTINILFEIKSLSKNGIQHFEGFHVLNIKPIS